MLEQQREYNKINRDKISERGKKYREEHKEELLEKKENILFNQ